MEELKLDMANRRARLASRRLIECIGLTDWTRNQVLAEAHRIAGPRGVGSPIKNNNVSNWRGYGERRKNCSMPCPETASYVLRAIWEQLYRDTGIELTEARISAVETALVGARYPEHVDRVVLQLPYNLWDSLSALGMQIDIRADLLPNRLIRSRRDREMRKLVARYRFPMLAGAR